MPTRFILNLFAVMVFSLSHAMAQATVAIPEAKPLSTRMSPGFIEGVDVPVAKPPPVQIPAAASPPDPGSIVPPQPPEHPAACDLTLPPGPVTKPAEGDTECGIAAPVTLSGFGPDATSIRLGADVVLSCDFARTLTAWVRADVSAISLTELGSAITSVATGPGYVCRRRNNLPDGKLSEHGRGKALDLTVFSTADGRSIDVESNWGKDTDAGRFLAAIHAAACKRFTTVLGPDADPNHKAHFHLDTGCHGRDCGYLICQ